MRVNTLRESFSWAIAYSMRWLALMIPTETPSRRYVRRLKVRPMRFTSGSGALKEKVMGRILDPDWSQFEYVPAAKTNLWESMERYKRMVDGENKKICLVEKVSDDSKHHGQVFSEQANKIGRAHV